MGQLPNRHIGRIMLDGGFLQHHELECALAEQKHTKELLGQVLIRKGTLKADDFKVILVVQEHLRTIEGAVKIAAGEQQYLGELLVQSGRITSKQLDNMLAEQQHSGEKLGEVLQRRGILTTRQLNALLEFQRNQTGTHPSPLKLGELLVATGRVTREHLEDALHQQTLSKKKLGEVLVEAGYARHSCIEYCISLQKMLLKSVLVAILSLGMFAGSPVSDTAYAEIDGTCEYSIQLQSSPMRGEYIRKLAAEEPNLLTSYDTNIDHRLQSQTPDATSNNQEESIDSSSINCLACHDGAAVKIIRVDYRNNPGRKTKGYEVNGQHPIGMDYAAYSAMDSKKFKPASDFNSEMIFTNGRVGCTTCHNPLNPEKNHLAMGNPQSDFCLTCHIK